MQVTAAAPRVTLRQSRQKAFYERRKWDQHGTKKCFTWNPRGKLINCRARFTIAQKCKKASGGQAARSALEKLLPCLFYKFQVLH
jgi:hypothetical protein